MSRDPTLVDLMWDLAAFYGLWKFDDFLTDRFGSRVGYLFNLTILSLLGLSLLVM